ncbi:MAG: dihydrofolate reductase [Candidatus Thorarchaeota archaeon]
MAKCGLIVAMTQNHIIGLDGRIPWHYSPDMRRFKKITIGTTVIMGRITWESLPKRPLPRRRNIVLTRSHLNNLEGAECFNNLEEALTTVESDSWIIGGGQIFNLALQKPEIIDIIDVTIVPDIIQSPQAVYFPEIDKNVWKKIDSKRLEGDVLIKVCTFQKH